MNQQITERIMNTLNDNATISGYQGISGNGDGYGHDYSDDYDYNPAYEILGEGYPSKYGSFIGDDYGNLIKGEGDVPLDPRRFARSYLMNENHNATSAEIKRAYNDRIQRSALSGVKKQAHLNKAKRIKNMREVGLKQKPHHLAQHKARVQKKHNISEALREGREKYDNFINAAIEEGNTREEAKELWKNYKKLLETDIHLEHELEHEPEHELEHEPEYKQITTKERGVHALPIYDRDYFKQSLFYVADELKTIHENLHNLAVHLDYLE